MEHYAGIDVSLERLSVCVVDALRPHRPRLCLQNSSLRCERAIIESGHRDLRTHGKRSMAFSFVPIPSHATALFLACASSQVLDKRLGIPQIRCVKALGELVVN